MLLQDAFKPRLQLRAVASVRPFLSLRSRLVFRLSLSMQLSLPRRFDSTLSPSMIAPRCGSKLQVIVADLCGERRCHIFSASATLKSFQHTLALSRGIEVSRLIAVHHGAIIEGDAAQTLVSLGLQDGSIVHAFAREPTTVSPFGHSAAEPPGCVRSAWQLGSGASGLEAPLQPRAASGFLSTPHPHPLAPVDTMAPIDARVGWASWSKSQSPASGQDLGLDVVELGYVPFETSGEALQASRCDLESQASTCELESHVLAET